VSSFFEEDSMGTTLTPDNVPPDRAPGFPKGHDTRSLGPGDSSDSGSDLAGVRGIDDKETESELSGGESVADGDDLSPDRIVGADEAGLGGGLDEAEEAQLGVTDEELQERESSQTRRPPSPRKTGKP
jgi:hypothetical protein